jgi:hypothetical protein
VTPVGNAVPLLRAREQKRVYDADEVDAYVSHLQQSCSDLARRLAAADTILAVAVQPTVPTRVEPPAPPAPGGGPWVEDLEVSQTAGAAAERPDPIFLDDDRPMPWEMDAAFPYPWPDGCSPDDRPGGLAMLLQRWRSRSTQDSLEGDDLLSASDRLASLADGSYLGELRASTSDPFAPDGAPIDWPEPNADPALDGTVAPCGDEAGNRQRRRRLIPRASLH